MHMRDDVRPANARALDVRSGPDGRSNRGHCGRLVDGLGRSTLMAITALVGCGVLIAFGAAVSLCWMVHPLLSAAVGVALVWVIARLAGKLFWCSKRNR